MKIIITIILIAFYPLISFCQDDKIIVGGDFDYPPYSFIDKNGNEAGYDVDVINAIAKITGLDIEFRFTNWDTTLTRLENGKIDIVTGIVYSAEREKIYDFSFPLHTEYYGIFAKKSTLINDINDLEMKRPAILTGDISNELFFKPMGLFKDYVITQSFPQAFSLVNSNKCDYVIVPYPLGMKVINDNGLSDIEVKDPPIIPSVYCLAVKDGDYELLAWLNQGIEILIRNGELDRIYDKWVKYKREEDQYKTFFHYTLIGLMILAGVIIILLLFWYSLKRQIKKKTQEIKNREVIYQNVFNSVDDGLIIFDESEKIINANKKSYSIFDYDNGQLIGENVVSVAKYGNRNLLQEITDIIKSDKSFYKENIEIKTGDKTHYLILKGLKIDMKDKKRYLIVIHDITKEHISFLKLQDAKKNVDSANKAKSTFLSTISHEIRTPLFAIIGFAELLSKTTLSKKQSDYNSKIEISGKLLLNLVNDILDLTKIEAEKLELNLQAFNIRELIKEICDVESLRVSEKNIDLYCKIDDNVPDFLIGDKLRLSQILLNILNNSVKFTNKGMVSLLVSVENLSELKINDKINIIFSIKDTGIGMPLHSQKKLFKPFEQIQNTNERKYGGTGLGLAISKQLVDLMEGDILIESTVGKGSVFNVSIPLKIFQGTIESSKNEFDELKLTERISVLLVEDNVFNAEILFEQLTEANFSVIHAKSGADAIEQLKKNDFHIILMDIEMPDMDGFETLKKIKQLDINETPVIALSAHDLYSEKEKALSVGMLDYLCKPVSIKELSRAIYKYKTDSKQKRKGDQAAINRKKGLDFFENNIEKYNRALLRFKKHYTHIPEKLAELFEENPLLIKDYTHNLKSAAKTIGAIKLAETAKKYDNILRNKPGDFTFDSLQVLIAELKKVLIEIDRVS